MSCSARAAGVAASSVVTDPTIARSLLAALELPPEPATFAPARDPPQVVGRLTSREPAPCDLLQYAAVFPAPLTAKRRLNVLAACLVTISRRRPSARLQDALLRACRPERIARLARRRETSTSARSRDSQREKPYDDVDHAHAGAASGRDQSITSSAEDLVSSLSVRAA
jgi:hypothetical protein